MKYNISTSTIYQLYERQIEFLLKNQNSDDDKELNSSINMSIILCSACLVEGVLEDRAKLVLGYYSALYHSLPKEDLDTRRLMNLFFNRTLHGMNDRVSFCVGIKKYNEYFKTTIGKSMYDYDQIKHLIEPVSVLFQLRNVIAHGRCISVYAYELEDNVFEECFFGGYKKAQDLLMKNGLLENRYLDTEDPKILFSNRIAKYFLGIANQFISGLDQFVEDNIHVTDRIKENISKVCKATQQNWTKYEYFRWRANYALIDNKTTYDDFEKI